MIVTRYSDINNIDPQLRPYQQKAKREIFEAWDRVDNVMFQMPTGTGKTRLFTSIIRDINQYSLREREAVKILIIAHRTELIDQIDESLKKYQVPHNVIGGSKKRDEDKNVNVATIQTLTRPKRLNEKKFPVHVASIQTLTHPKNFKDAKKLNVQFIIIDEAHHALATTYKKLWDLYPGSKKLGVTATPWRMNHQSFTDLFGMLVTSMPIKDFIKHGYLSSYKYYSLRDDSAVHKTIDGIELDKFGEYSESSMEEKMDVGSIRAQLLKSYLELAKGKKGIIYAININHAKHISEEYRRAGYKAEYINSKTSDTERKYIVDEFKEGKIDIIVNVDIFSEGFDCPDIEFIQLARPTRSLAKYLQQVGRGLRPTKNKGHCIILDNVGMYANFGLPDARRDWEYYFLGHEVDEEPAMRNMSNGTGESQHVDMSEGTEDMELIQSSDIAEQEPETAVSEAFSENSTSLHPYGLFPLWGITLGKTTLKDARDMGHRVIKCEDDSRYIDIRSIHFWAFDDNRTFTSAYWMHDDTDFPADWKTMGFSWDNSYEEWKSVFERLGYEIEVTKRPIQKDYRDREDLKAEFIAVSSDKNLMFTMVFGYGRDGCEDTSPRTLYSIFIDYTGLRR